MAAARLTIVLTDGDLVVHEFRRSTAVPSAAGIVRMLEAGQGWLQAYAGAINEEQWAADVRRAEAAQP